MTRFPLPAIPLAGRATKGKNNRLSLTKPKPFLRPSLRLANGIGAQDKTGEALTANTSRV